MLKLIKCIKMKYCLDYDVETQSKIYKSQDQTGRFIWACSDCDYASKNKHDVLKHIEAKHLVTVAYLVIKIFQPKML